MTLSDQMVEGISPRVTKFLILIAHEFVSMDESITIYLDLVVIHVKKKYHRFSEIFLMET